MIAISPARAAPALSSPRTGGAPLPLGISRAAASALSRERDPMMTGYPAAAHRIASPEPSAPVPPMMASVGRFCIARLYRPLHSPREARDRIVAAVDHPLLQRNDGVVGDADVLRTHIGAAFRDVAIADACLVFHEVDAVPSVEWMHLERGEAREEARAHVC